jgi:hypothetical protein
MIDFYGYITYSCPLLAYWIEHTMSRSLNGKRVAHILVRGILKAFLSDCHSLGQMEDIPSFQMALQPGVGLGLLYKMPPGLSIPCSVSSFVYTHLSQVHGQSSSHLIFGLLSVLLRTAFHTSFWGCYGRNIYYVQRKTPGNSWKYNMYQKM